jgi:hypothetical protein
MFEYLKAYLEFFTLTKSLIVNLHAIMTESDVILY